MIGTKEQQAKARQLIEASGIEMAWDIKLIQLLKTARPIIKHQLKTNKP